VDTQSRDDPISPSYPERGPFRSLAAAACVFALLSAVYMVTYSGTPISTDELGLLASLESLVKRGDFSMHQIEWYGYSVGTFEPAPILLAAPLYWLGLWLPGVGAVQIVYLFNVIVTAATGALVFLYVLRLGYRWSTAVTLALLFGLATTTWAYSKFFFREPLAALALLTTAYLMLNMAYGGEPKGSGRGQVSATLLAAAAFGLAVTAKVTNIAALPAFLIVGTVFLVDGARTSLSASQRLRVGSCGVLAVCGVLALLAALNSALIGSPSLGTRLNWGSVTSLFVLTTEMRDALVQMVLSPGKGLLPHSPILVLGLVAIPMLWRQRRWAEVLLPVLLLLGFLRAYSIVWWVWWGGRTWGPRYFVPLLPFLVILLAPVVEAAISRRALVLRAALLLLTVASLIVQIGGVAVNVELFASSLSAVREDAAWTLAITDPQYSEILGHLRLLRPENLDFAWVRFWDSQLSMDWAVPVLCLAGICLAVLSLLQVCRRNLSAKALSVISVATLLVPAVLAAFALPRYYDDPHYRREKEWQSVLATLQQQEQPGDVLILNVPTHAEYFLNYSHAWLPWYGLEKETWPVKHEAILDALLHGYHRIWLATEFFPEADQYRGVERWLVEHAYKVADTQFGYPARLMLFLAPSQPPPAPDKLAPVASFGDAMAIDLLGARYPTEPVHAGQPVPVTIYWQARRPLNADYTVTLQLWDSEGKLRRQMDRQPVDGFRPTSTWRPWEVIADNFGLVLPSDLPAGTYRLVVGMYRWPALTRLPVSAPDDLTLPEAGFLLIGQIGVDVSVTPPLPYPILR